MINYYPVRVLFNIFGIRIYSWGFFVSLGILVALLTARKLYKKEFEEILNSFLITFICSIIGARLLYVILNLNHFLQKPIEMINFQGGGLSFFGALFFGLLGFIIYFKISRIDFKKYLDIYAIFIPIVQAFGRIGCFLNGCCYGRPTKLFFGIEYLGTTRHPVQIYESILNLIVFLLLYKTKDKKQLRIFSLNIKLFSGARFLLYLILYSIVRFFMEFFREEKIILLGLTQTQILCLFIIMISIFLLFKKQRIKQNIKKKRKN
ncbi:MAG: prolipoprotein diacylglyceryl transferase [Candidatus Woesearchaeota archaeon]